MSSDLVKLIFTYAIALVLIVGGLVFLYATRSEATATDLRILVGGFMGSAITFVFNAESALRATRAAEKAYGSPALPPGPDPSAPPTV